MSKKEKPKKSLLKRLLFKLPWIIGFALIFMLVSLKAMERFPVPLKEGFESYLVDISGYKASIGSLKKMSFIPSLEMHLEDVFLSDLSNVAIPKMTIESLHVHMPFLNMFLGGRTLYNFEVSGVEAEEAVIFSQALVLNSLKIVEEDEPQLKGEGLYAQKALIFSLDLEKNKSLTGKKVFSIPSQTTLNLLIGDINLRTFFSNESNTIWLRGGVLKVKDAEIPIKDAMIVENGGFSKDNIISCLLAQDYQNISNICDDYTLLEDVE